MPDRATFRGDKWRAYVDVNKEFANCTIKALKNLLKSGQDLGSDKPLIWIHDYHLMLAANWIRQVIYFKFNVANLNKLKFSGSRRRRTRL
jgi:trehalose 6-phosphate synthase/phosphatase